MGYAARAGTTTEFAFGDSLSSEQANFWGKYPYGGAEKGKLVEKPAVVGSYKPNAWGLYDMHGNVREWCEDIWNKDGYHDLPTDGSANLTIGKPDAHVTRGGSWDSFGFYCRSAARFSPMYYTWSTGFRLVARAK